ncbi:MAG: hypothetical protein J1E58_00815 [Prevotella sp.]|nr:hypothetical protein [Prevotella sp.]
MKFIRNITLAIALAACAASQSVSAKSLLAPKAYIFGFAASFNDSTVYFTGIQEMDSVWVDPKNGFLLGRSNYSYQLRDYFSQKLDQPHRTCVVISSLKRQDVEKKYLKMKRQYTVKNAGKYDVRNLTDADFRFKAVNMGGGEVEKPKATRNDKKAKKNKKQKNKK